MSTLTYGGSYRVHIRYIRGILRYLHSALICKSVFITIIPQLLKTQIRIVQTVGTYAQSVAYLIEEIVA